MNDLATVIFANGIVRSPEAARRLVSPGAFVICADGGLRHARALGLTPAVVIGDLDSVEPSHLTDLEAAGVTLIRHNPSKDETDLELAVIYALERDPASIVIIGGLGARIDHTLGNIALLSDARLAALECRIDDGTEELLFCRREVGISGAPGDIVSLLPWGGPAEGVRTNGLRWALRGERLSPERTRGISNEMLGSTARVYVEQGAVLVIHTRAREAHTPIGRG